MGMEQRQLLVAVHRTAGVLSMRVVNVEGDSGGRGVEAFSG